jgi:hypothetical protein
MSSLTLIVGYSRGGGYVFRRLLDSINLFNLINLLKLLNEELHNLQFSLSKIRMIKQRRMRWAGHVASMGKKKNAYRILVEKSEVMRPLGRRRYRWENNIKMDLRELWGNMDSINLVDDWEKNIGLLRTRQ